MSLRAEPENLLDLVKDLQRRVRDLETAQSVRRTSINGGALTVIDDSGVVQARYGLLSDGTYGLEVRRANGTFGKVIVS